MKVGIEVRSVQPCRAHTAAAELTQHCSLYNGAGATCKGTDDTSGSQVGIGICTKSTAEYTKRGDHFWNEIDYVGANLAMAIVADFMLVWLPAPTLAFRLGSAGACQTCLAVPADAGKTIYIYPPLLKNICTVLCTLWHRRIN